MAPAPALTEHGVLLVRPPLPRVRAGRDPPAGGLGRRGRVASRRHVLFTAAPAPGARRRPTHGRARLRPAHDGSGQPGLTAAGPSVPPPGPLTTVGRPPAVRRWVEDAITEVATISEEGRHDRRDRAGPPSGLASLPAGRRRGSRLRPGPELSVGRSGAPAGRRFDRPSRRRRSADRLARTSGGARHVPGCPGGAR